MLKDYSQAILAWKKVVGDGFFFFENSYSELKVLGRICPVKVEEVIEIIRISSKYGIPVYAISTGQNWGYGGAKPTCSGCVILDLSRMVQILHIDRVVGLVTVEPGVTMGQLHEFLKVNKIPFVSPRVGSGPDCSLIGNVLEKGRSGVGFIDRFASLVSLKVVLADGSIYESSSGSQNNKQSFFKWGIGPYLDGLFVQSNLGVVIEATFALAPSSEHKESFYIPLHSQVSIAAVATVLQHNIEVLGNTLGSVSIQNAERIRSRISQLRQVQNIPQWYVLGSLQGDVEMVRAARRRLSREFAPFSTQSFFFTKQKLESISWLGKYIKYPKQLKSLYTMLPLLRSMEKHTIDELREQSYFLQKNQNILEGLLFVPIVLPADGLKMENFISQAEIICKNRAVPFPVSLLNFTNKSFLFVLLLKFDTNNEFEKKSILMCFSELKIAAEGCGGYVYRASVDTMSAVISPDTVFWKIVKKIKLALDPENIIAPGRYEID